VNDLTGYAKIRSLFQPGDLIVSWCGDFLSSLIRLFAAGGPTHCSVVRQGAHPGFEPTLIESTILHGRNGVQTNRIDQRAAAYPGSMALLSLNADQRARMDLEAFYRFCGAAEDHVRYDVGGLVEFLAREIPIAGARLAQSAHEDRMVCSAFATALWTRTGLLHGINWSKVWPQDLVEMKLYSGWHPIVGAPPKMARFNTVE
jgi:hypothetical protein